MFNPVDVAAEPVYEMLREARNKEPIFYAEEFGCWVLTRYDDIVEVLQDNRHFTTEGILAGLNDDYGEEANALLDGGVDWREIKHVQNTEGEEHARLRHYLQSILSPVRFRRMEPTVRDIATGLIDRVIDQGCCELVEAFSYPLPIRTIFRVIGFSEDEEDMDQLQVWSDNTFKMWLTPMTAEEQAECARDAVRFQDYMREKIDQRRVAPRDDLLSELIQAADDGASLITDEELIIIFTHNLIGAGHETTRAQITNMFYQLLKDRDRWDYVLAHPEQIPEVVEEVIRFDPSVLGWYRKVAEATEINGRELKTGDLIFMCLGSGNRDESRFHDSETFCPHREARERPLTFTQGAHFCLGAPLARIELKVALEAFSRRLPNLRLAEPQAIEYFPSLPTRVISSLEIEWGEE